MRKGQVGFILVLFLFFLQKDLYAATVSHSAEKSDIRVDDELKVDVDLSINAPQDTAYYLRGVFYRPGDNNYCGYTWNGSSWFSGPYTTNEGWRNFLKVSIWDNKWEGTISAKIDPEDSGCNKSGEYIFKIQRFTDSGSGNFDDQNETKVYVTIPTPTPTSQPTATKIPTKRPSPKFDDSDSFVLSTTMTERENSNYAKSILGDKNSSEKNKSKDSKRKYNKRNSEKEDVSISLPDEKNDKKGGSIYVYLGGASMLVGCGILLFRAYRSRQEEG